MHKTHLHYDYEDILIVILITETVVKSKTFNQYIEVTRSWGCAILVRISFEILDTQDLTFLGYSRVIWSVIKLRHFISPSMEECIKAKNVQGYVQVWADKAHLRAWVGTKNGNLKARYIFITIENTTRVYLNIHVYIWWKHKSLCKL